MSEATPNTATNNAAAPAPAADTASADAQGLLQQADMLKEQQMEAAKLLEKEKQANLALQRELAAYRAKAEAEQEAYAKAQEPKLQEYLEQIQITAGKKLPESKVLQYRNMFTRLEFKEDADLHYANMREKIELRASAKKAEEEAAKLKNEKMQLEVTLSKASQQVGGMRKTYAEALAPERMEEPARKDVSVTASLGANEIMCAAPSSADLPFLQKFGFSNEVGVNASENPFGQTKPIRRSVQAAREHRLLYDENGDCQFPASARIHNPHIFGWYVNESPVMTMDLSDMVSINASKTFIEEKRVDL
ncbi:MAG: hypothetical protein K2Q45_06645 [Nitrosomonas sp.]|nr:hypothetical protein [Nitrosomonas sp.]